MTMANQDQSAIINPKDGDHKGDNRQAGDIDGNRGGSKGTGHQTGDHSSGDKGDGKQGDGTKGGGKSGGTGGGN